MRRRSLLAAGPVAAFAPPASGSPSPLANGYTVLHESPDPGNIHLLSPGITRLSSGRLVAVIGRSGVGRGRFPGSSSVPLPLPGIRNDRWHWHGLILTSRHRAGRPKGSKVNAAPAPLCRRLLRSDDRGRTWQQRSEMPLYHARPFAAGSALYILGHFGDLHVMRSTDEGETWSGPVAITQGQFWHQSACAIVNANGRVYVVMERVTDPAEYYQSVLAPVLMAGQADRDLRQRESWVFSNEITFRQAWNQTGPPRLIGVPFYQPGLEMRAPVKGRTGRRANPPSWLETNVVQIHDPDHIWHDPAGRTFHLFLRANTGGTNLACLLKAVESQDRRSIHVSLENAPSGEPMLYVPLPGGHMRFHILWDDKTHMYWLLSTQSTDSMRRLDRMPPERFDLPNNERHRMALHFSRNCIDWCFAGLVADSGSPDQARHYAAMVIDGADLHLVSRSGDARARNAHDCNLITFHTVKDFRGLVY